MRGNRTAAVAAIAAARSRSRSARAGAATTAAASSGAVKGQTIEYWASNQGATIDQDKQVIKEAAARFKKESGVTVKFKVIPWSDLWNNITTATTSGKGPDVLNIGNTWSASLQATGAFMPFNGDTLKTIGGKDKFLQTSYSASGAPGKTPTSVPLYGLSYALFYNKKLFKDAEPPAAEDVVGVRRHGEEADEGHERRRQARPVGLRDGGRRASPRTRTSRSSSGARTAVSCSTATSRRSTPTRSSRASATT